MELQDIPKRKPRDYPRNFRRWEWIGDVMMVHAWSRRVWGKRIPTFTPRTDRGRAQVWAGLRRRFPYAFAKDS